MHLVLSIYALGGSPEDIKTAYENNKSMQRPALPTDLNVVRALHDKAIFRKSLGMENNYPNFLAFFQQEVDQKGVGEVLNEYVFAGDEIAESMLLRLFGGKSDPCNVQQIK